MYSSSILFPETPRPRKQKKKISTRKFFGRSRVVTECVCARKRNVDLPRTASDSTRANQNGEHAPSSRRSSLSPLETTHLPFLIYLFHLRGVDHTPSPFFVGRDRKNGIQLVFCYPHAMQLLAALFDKAPMPPPHPRYPFSRHWHEAGPRSITYSTAVPVLRFFVGVYSFVPSCRCFSRALSHTASQRLHVFWSSAAASLSLF